MNTTGDHSQDTRLHELLREARPETSVPPRFQDGVWRRIQKLEIAAGEAGPGWLARLAGWLMQPRLAGALALALVLAGAGFGALQGSAAARQTSQQRYLAAVAPSTVR